MSKTKVKTALTQDEFEAELQSEPLVFNSCAVGISPRSDGGYNIIKVPVDSKGLRTGEVVVLDTAEGKAEANEKFKIYVIRTGIL